MQITKAILQQSHAQNRLDMNPVEHLTVLKAVFFYRLDTLPDAQPTVSKHWKLKAGSLNRSMIICNLLQITINYK